MSTNKNKKQRYKRTLRWRMRVERIAVLNYLCNQLEREFYIGADVAAPNCDISCFSIVKRTGEVLEQYHTSKLQAVEPVISNLLLAQKYLEKFRQAYGRRYTIQR